MTGHIRRRGKRSWELKFDVGANSCTGRRKIRYITVRGTRKDAERELTKLLNSRNDGTLIDSSKVTVAQFLDRWEQDWARVNLGAKTFERYSELLTGHVRHQIGAVLLQKLTPAALASLYSQLLQSGRKRPADKQSAGLSANTVGYVHRVLHRAFGHAVTWGLIATNPASAVEPPRVKRDEIEILTEAQVKEVLQKLRGTALHLIALLGLSTGMRRGELLALRWKNVDLDAGRIHVEQSLEQTKGKAGVALRLKQPKTRHGRRTLSLSQSAISALREHRKKQAEQRLALGLGKEAGDALVFRHLDGSPLIPHSITTQWSRFAKRSGLAGVTLHAWRHTHASQLISSGMDVLTISRRLGHASASITLDVYGHLFHSSDDLAAAVFDKAFGGTVGE